jgi:hypothetical protein
MDRLMHKDKTNESKKLMTQFRNYQFNRKEKRKLKEIIEKFVALIDKQN